jgi:hypothetical protein
LLQLLPSLLLLLWLPLLLPSLLLLLWLPLLLPLLLLLLHVQCPTMPGTTGLKGSSWSMLMNL